MRIASIVFALFLILCGTTRAAERSFYSGYIGTLPSSPLDRAKTYFNRAEVRALLAHLESGPLPKAEAERLLAGTATQMADLVHLHLIRTEDGLVRIDFPYFTARDVASIHAVAKKYVPRLVADYKAAAPRMNAILARYPAKSVPRRRIAFVLLAGFGLNWDALDLLTERHDRQPVLITGPGWHYGFWASEDVRGFSYAGYYWGSSSFPAGDINLKPPLDFTFSSFGDPDSDPRMNFPDLLGLPPDQMTPPVRAAAEALGLRNDDSLGESMKHVIGPARARDIGPMLFAIRAGAQTKAGACAHIAQASDCDALFALLAATGYVHENAGRYALAVPVFDLRDEAMVQDFLKLNRRVLSRWLDRSYAPMRSELAGLTAERQGVPYPALFSQIWHELFGLATRELAEEGVIEDPRGADAAWKGSVPVLWRTAIYRHLWQ